MTGYRRLAICFYLATMAALHLGLAWNSRRLIREGYSDFAIFYTAGRIVRDGFGPQLYDPDLQYAVQRAFAPRVAIRQGPLPYNHPPFEALLFAPFTLLSYPRAFLAFDVLNVAMLIASLAILREHLRSLAGFSLAYWILAALAFFPIAITLIQGQDAILMLFLFVLSFSALQRRRLLLAGLWLGLASFKPQMVLPFLILLVVMRGGTILMGYVLAIGGLAMVSLAGVGWQSLLAYPRYALRLEMAGARAGILPTDMPNLRGLVSLFLVPGPAATTVTVLTSAVLLWIAVRRCWNSRPKDFSWKISLAVLATVLVSYHALSHDLTLLLLPILLVANYLLSGEANHGLKRWLGFCLALLFFSPAYLLLGLVYHRLAFAAVVLLVWFAGLSWEGKESPVKA